MRISYVLLFLLAAFSVPAAAADADENLKKEVEKIGSAYAESFNRQDGAGIAALYASGGMHVNAAGPRTDIAEFYEGAFKAGFNHEDITVNQVWPLGTERPSRWANTVSLAKTRVGRLLRLLAFGLQWTFVRAAN